MTPAGVSFQCPRPVPCPPTHQFPSSSERPPPPLCSSRSWAARERGPSARTSPPSSPALPLPAAAPSRQQRITEKFLLLSPPPSTGPEPGGEGAVPPPSLSPPLVSVQHPFRRGVGSPGQMSSLEGCGQREEGAAMAWPRSCSLDGPSRAREGRVSTPGAALLPPCSGAGESGSLLWPLRVGWEVPGQGLIPLPGQPCLWASEVPGPSSCRGGGPRGLRAGGLGEAVVSWLPTQPPG